MDLHEKINYLLDEKLIKKKEFVNRVRALEPKLKTTGEIPSEQTIYRYISGKREIKVELIPYFAEALNVSIEDLFSSDIEYSCQNNVRYSKEAREILNLLAYMPSSTTKMILETMRRYKELHDDTKQSLTK